MKKRYRLGLGIIIFFLVNSSLLVAQMIKIRAISLKDFPEISLVVSVENIWGASIPVDLKNIKIFELNREISNKKITPLDSFKAPIYTIIIIDKSGSMKGKAIEQAQKGAIEFVSLMKGRDKAAIVEFDTQVKVISNFTNNKKMLSDKISMIRSGSDTALLDALFKGIKLFDNAPDNTMKIIMILTDGRENKSLKSSGDILNMAKQSGISIFTIGLGEKIDEKMLQNIARKTSANYYHVPKPAELVKIYRQISLLLHSQLEIKFKTPFAMDDSWHEIKITLSHLGKMIQGCKAYLSAAESRIATDLLRKIMAKEEQKAELENKKNKAINLKKAKEQQKKENLILTLLLAVLILLLIALLITMVLKIKKNKNLDR